ncbi:Spo0E family sporulation regulatory protein-aspartic acid phosphatase [Paenibacillus castaneae]|uniref:Spo0E family sporulation regulatory protein-aspartic acid phosphatase n=1 Tax=Paenibacillus castaneae TaxID=474957 RepID=UPI000C99F853|nr:aspartyl-phosphate phosphatase Spo0E family protein [Paenibacillus castaneae]
MICACRQKIEVLRNAMTLAFNKVGSFTDASVLAASQSLDEALVEYRKCSMYELCNTDSWRQIDKESQNSNVANPNPTIKKIAI